MENNYSSVIDEIMPLVRDGDKSKPFIITRDSAYGDWLVCYPQPAADAKSFFTSQREHDPFAVMFTGADFANGSFPYVYDKVLCARLWVEFHANPVGTVFGGELSALMNLVDENISRFSEEAFEYLLKYDNPLRTLYDINPVLLYNNSGSGGEPYDTDKVDEFFEAIEYKIQGFIETSEESPSGKESRFNLDDGKHHIDGYIEKLSILLAGRLVILAENPKADAPYMVCEGRWDNPLGVLEYHNIDLMCDYVEAMRKFVDTTDSLLITLEQERSAFGLAPRILTAGDCIPGGLGENLKGKAIVIKPEALAPEYHSAEYQIQICVGGFGASPGSRGNAVFCKNLYSGDARRFERQDMAGILDPAKTPQWAARKLALADAIKEPGVFEYGVYHFKPVRQFRKGEANRKLKGDSRGKMDMQFAMRNMKDDASLRIDWTDYTNEKFYAVSGSDADIFKCVENGKLYVPCSGKLFEYNEPPQRAKALEAPAEKKKPSLLGELEEAKTIVAAQNARRGGKPQTKKRGEAEVS